jgi:hypothetical protein
MNARWNSAKKPLIISIGVIAILWLAGCAGIYSVMRQPPERFASVMARIPGPVAFLVLPFETLWKHARAGSLQIGDHAPDFTLAKLDKSEQIQLSSLTAQGRPVVLVFGSYT